MANTEVKKHEQTENNKMDVEVEINEQACEQTEQDEKAAENSGEPAGEIIQLTKDDFAKVKCHIEALQKEKEEAIALAQRLQADFDNYRKRNAALRLDSYEEGKRDCMKALLPVIDNFDRALESTEGVNEGFLEGIRLLQRMLLDVLGQFGLKEISAEGIFDPHLHHAVVQEAVEGKASGEILEVLQKGYAANEKILRHSAVKVAE